MVEYQTVDYTCYPSGEDLIAWVPDRVEFLNLDPAHLRVLEFFKEPKSIDAAVSHDLGDLPKPFKEICDELVENGLLIANEYRHPGSLQYTFEPLITAFRVVMTEACNFACPGCFSTTALRSNKSKLKTMSDETVEQLFKAMIPYGKERSILVHFFGGEPLIRFKQIQQATALLQSAVDAGQMIAPKFSITTNGYLVDEEVISFFKEHNFEVGVSVEGAKLLHDSIRVTRTGEATFDKVSQHYDRLRNAGVDVHVLFTPYVDMQQSMPEQLNFLLDRFPSHRITINTAFAEHTLGWQVREDYADLLVACERIGKERGVEIDSALSPVLFAIGAQVCRESPQATTANEVMVSVDTEGRVSRSTQKWYPALLEAPLKDLGQMRMQVTKAPDCIRCTARSVCGGPNEEYQLATTSLLDSAKCQFHRRALNVIAENLELFT